MRQKSRKLILTFHTTTAAIAMESLCQRRGIPGRLIPVPREITANCGMAWCAEPREEELLRRAVEEEKIPVAGWYQVEI